MTRPRFEEASTKIVATVGPASDSVDRLAELIEAGVDVFRINTAHGTREDHDRVLAAIRQAAEQTRFPVGVLLDLAGPKMRLGQLVSDPLQCDWDMRVSFVRGDTPGAPNELTSSYKRLIDELEVGDRVMLADGTVALKVEKVTADRADCRVTGPGEVRSRQGINLPGVKLSVSALLPKDIDNVIWAVKNDIDFISLSFVRSASDVKSLKSLLQGYESEALVIAKIEKPEALEDLENIVEESDGVMVARGDLGVEIDVADTPVAQKRIIRVCQDKMKPVIVATQMLESMHHSRRPTRAEASDVANAVLDGTDACMLSGETAIGDYPVEAVKTMNRIMRQTERQLLGLQRVEPPENNHVHPVTTAVTLAATGIAETIAAKVLVIATHSGGTAWVKSKSGMRSLIPTLGASDDPRSVRRMSLFWGIKPLLMPQIDDAQRLISEICQWGRMHDKLHAGDKVVFVAGTGVMKRANNFVLVHTVE
ncbi:MULTISPECIES: pyruvate kinase [Crateriforma]|uniref:Pyruvate kinase n=1 Tax=Crateriforma conspicua TaxID=2527996 RepID=A0A5C6FQH9_9PLAN|nr:MULTISPECIES: pyruvate kinase [Crateriforma]TWU65129.1 Pyruvate kinase [Crateriforma conspicua]